jgi:hypothetical protein
VNIDQSLAYIVPIVSYDRWFRNSRFNIPKPWQMPKSDLDYFVARGIFKCWNDENDSMMALTRISGEQVDFNYLNEHAGDLWRTTCNARHKSSVLLEKAIKRFNFVKLFKWLVPPYPNFAQTRTTKRGLS